MLWRCILYKKLLVIYSTFNKSRPIGDPSVWYRCFAFAEKLKDKKGITCDLLNSDDVVKYSLFDFSRYEGVIFFRPIQTIEFIELYHKLKRMGVNVFASYDDLTFNPDSYTQASTLKSMARIDLIHNRYKDWANALLLFEDIIVSSKALESEIKKIHPNCNVLIISNVLPNSVVNHINYLKHNNADRQYIGYFGGGLSHREDISMIENELVEFLSINNRKLLMPEVISKKLSEKLNRHIIPYKRVALYKMYELYRNTKFNIAPLALDRNSSCKSGIKFLESALSGAPLAATYIESYDEYKDFGALVANNHSWSKTLREAYDYHIDEGEILNIYNRMEDVFDDEISQLTKRLS